MKKILLIAALVLLVLAGSAIWIWRSTGITDPAVILPADTVAFVSLPDLPRTGMRWPKTTLSQIGAELEMKDFLAKPLQYLTENWGGDEAADLLLKLKPGRIFAATLSASGKEAAMVVGFQYWGGKSAYDTAVARLRQEIAAGQATKEPTKENYQGTEIASSTQNGVSIFSATQGWWGFLSNDLPALKATLDRATGRVRENSLAESARYQTVVSHLLTDPDLILFVQPQEILTSLLEIGRSLGAQVIPQQIDQARKVEALGATIKLDGADLHDRIFVLRPNPPEIGSLTHKAARFAGKDATAYFDFIANFAQISSLSTNPLLARFAGLPGFQESKLPELLPQAFGPECAVTVSWEESPDGLLAVEVRDAARAEESLQELLALFPETTVQEADGVRNYSFPTLQSSFANPTLTLTKDFLLIGLNENTLAAARQTAGSGSSLEAAAAFAHVLPSYSAANEMFGYVDMRNLFERGYPMLRQIMIFGAALMPGISDVIDSSKLPNTDTIAQHLNPIVFSQSRLPNGYLVDSQGPITMNQAVILGVLAGRPFLNLLPSQ